MKIPEFPFTIRELTPDDGGGFLIEFPDLPGCMSDGETVEEAMAFNGSGAVRELLHMAHNKISLKNLQFLNYRL